MGRRLLLRSPATFNSTLIAVKELLIEMVALFGKASSHSVKSNFQEGITPVQHCRLYITEKGEDLDTSGLKLERMKGKMKRRKRWKGNEMEFIVEKIKGRGV